MYILDFFYKMNNFLNKHFGFSLSTSKMVVAKCLILIWNHSGIKSGTYFSPFQGVYYLYRGLRRAPKPYFGLILEFWIIVLNFFEWIILLNIQDSIEWIFFWMNILDFVLNWILNWIIFRPDSMKKWIFKTYRTGLFMGGSFRPNSMKKMKFQNGSDRAICKRPAVIQIFNSACLSIEVGDHSGDIIILGCLFSLTSL